MNTPPTTQADTARLCLSSTDTSIKVNVLVNDGDIDIDDTVFLTSAEFVNASDADLATLTVNAADSTITLAVKPNVNIVAGHVFEIRYNVKDDGLPASQCAMGILKIAAYPIPSIPSDTAICPGIRIALSPSTGGIWSYSNPQSRDTSVVRLLPDRTILGDSLGTATLIYTDTITGCSAKVNVRVKNYPIVGESFGKHIVCIGKTIELSNSVLGGVWSTINTSRVTFIDPSKNPVTLRGEQLGGTYVTYSVFEGVCETRATYQVKVISDEPPTIKIGFEK
jgi:hypothetical protein